MDKQYYYHAGVLGDGTSFEIWSEHTRSSHEAAAREARRMARRHGGRPVVECWDRAHGLRPGDCELVLGADFVD